MATPTPPGYSQPPEILPPERDSVPGWQAAEPIRESTTAAAPRQASRGWAYAPATYTLVGINCAVFLAMLAAHVSLLHPTSLQLLHWGATHPGYVVYNGEWWRVISAMFVHVGIIHLATNMWCLWNLGLLGEPLLGSFGVIAAYILCGAAGNLLSVAVGMYEAVFKHQLWSVGAGASGAVFGLAGVLIVLLKSPRLPIPQKELAGLRRNVFYFAIVNFIIGFGGNSLNLGVSIDNMAHLGGFLSGILLALPLVPRIGSPRPTFLLRRRLAVGMLTCVLFFFGVYMNSFFAVAPSAVRQ